MLIVREAVLLLAAESETFTVNDVVVPAVGVPEIRPAVLRVKPEGSVPEATDHV